MFVRILKDCTCTFTFWVDEHQFDRWKDDLWKKHRREETLKAGQVIRAVRVRPSKVRGCKIYAPSKGGMNRYLSVP